MQLLVKIAVTPLAGVWIEISVKASIAGNAEVTPLAGVWIEMLYLRYNSTISLSLPLRECGLKYTIIQRIKAGLRHSPCGSVD